MNSAIERDRPVLVRLIWSILFALSGTAIIKALGRPELFSRDSMALAGGCFVIVSIASILLHVIARSSIPLLFLAPVFYLATGEASSLMAVCALLLGSLRIGELVTRRFSSLRMGEASWQWPAYPLMVGLAINSAIVITAMNFAVNTQLNYWIVILLEISLFAFGSHRNLRRFPAKWSPGQYSLGLFFLLYLPYTVVPAYNFDDLAIHLFIPRQTELFQRYLFTPDFIGSLNVSFLPIGSYTAAFLLGGENSIRLLNLAIFTLGIFSIEAFLRERISTRASLFAVLFLLSTPLFNWILSISFVDSFFIATGSLFFLFFLEFFEKPAKGRLFQLGFLAGIAYLAKQQFILMALPAAVPLLWKTFLLHRAALRTMLSELLSATAIFLALIAPPLIRNFYITGNPLFPFFNAVFPNPFWPGPDLVDTRWQHPLTLKTLWDVTFHGTRYVENIDFSLGFLPFVFIPTLFVGLLFRKGGAQIAGLLLFVVIYTILWTTITGAYLRYLIGALIPLSVASALLLERITQTRRHGVLLAFLGLGPIVLLNFAAQFSIVNTANPYPVREAFTKDLNNSSMWYQSEIKKLFESARRRCGIEATGLIVDSPANYFALTKARSSYWQFPVLSTQLGSVSDEQLFELVFNENKFNYVVMPLTLPPVKFGHESFRNKVRLVEQVVDIGLFEPVGKECRAE